MKVAATIPIKSNSTRVKNKNFKLLGDKPLYQYIIDQIHVVPSRGGEYLLYNNGVDRLTLTTCHPRYSGKERLVVSVILKKIQSSA